MGSWGWLLPWKSWLAESVNDSSLVDVVRRHLKLHAIASGEANEALAHFPRNMGQHLMLVVQLDPEHGSWQNSNNGAFQLNVLFHTGLVSIYLGNIRKNALIN